jgi:transposase-like protein
MTKEEFKDLQLALQESGMSVTKYLQHVGINYNTYNYWRKKLKEKDSQQPELAPIFSTINIKTTLLKLWRYYVKYRVLKRHFL